MNPRQALSELRAFGDFQTVMLVGHEPDLSVFIESLLGVAGGAAIEVKKGALALLSVEPSGRGAVLRFLLPPKWTRPVEPPSAEV
jgi:phosphohistidine phosphatase SixA